jgi:hypothetical protein
MQRKKRMTIIYLSVLLLIIVSAITTFILIKPKKSTATNGQETAQSLIDHISRLKEYRRYLSEFNTALLILAALSATFLVVASRLSDEAADEQSELQTRADSLKEQKFTQFIQDVNMARGPRMITDHTAFVAAFRGKPTARAEILFNPNDEEAYELALQVKLWLGTGPNGDGAGWEVSEPKPIPSVGFPSAFGMAFGGDPKVPADAPPAIRYGALGGMAIASNRFWNPTDKTSSYSALMDAFFTARLVPSGERVPGLPDNSFVVIIGQRR